MKTGAIDQLQIFINDYQLRKPNGVIIFDSAIRVSINGQLQQINSEIHIISIRQMMVMYIITPLMQELDLPDIFNTESTFTFKYHKEVGLEINNGSELKVTIIPQ